MNKPIIIAETGTPPEKALKIYGSFSGWILQNHSSNDSFCVLDSTKSPSYPSVGDTSGLIITGSPSMVTEREPWSLELEEWVRELVSFDVPILGICYGHQLLAQALGGSVGFHPKGREIGTVPIELTNDCEADPLFSQSPALFRANVTHAQSVLTLPSNSKLLAKNEYEPIQAFRTGACAWGVQFHPEFSADIMRFYLFERFDSLQDQGLDIKELFDAVSETQDARDLLDNFIALCKNQQGKS